MTTLIENNNETQVVSFDDALGMFECGSWDVDCKNNQLESEHDKIEYDEHDKIEHD